MSQHKITSTFSMANEKQLSGVYMLSQSPDTYWEPGDVEAGEPEYFIDGEPVELAELPTGLDYVADALYCEYLKPFAERTRRLFDLRNKVEDFNDYDYCGPDFD